MSLPEGSQVKSSLSLFCLFPFFLEHFFPFFPFFFFFATKARIPISNSTEGSTWQSISLTGTKIYAYENPWTFIELQLQGGLPLRTLQLPEKESSCEN